MTSPTPKKKTLDFSGALQEMLAGKKITRKEWADPKEYGFLKGDWLSIHTKGQDHSWQVNRADLEVDDWEVV